MNERKTIKTIYLGYACYSFVVSGTVELTLKEEMNRREAIRRCIKGEFDENDFEGSFKDDLKDLPRYKFKFFLDKAEAEKWSYFEALCMGL